MSIVCFDCITGLCRSMTVICRPPRRRPTTRGPGPRWPDPMGSIVKLSCQAVAALALGVGLCTPRLAPADEIHGQIRALPVATGVRLDGRLDEPFWAAADSVADFRQREPTEGAPASERTVVKLARDASALYVGVRAQDHDVAHVRATQLRRDADLEGDDNV